MKISKNEIIDEIVRYFEEHDDALTEAMESLDAYNGYLSNDRIYDMGEMNELFCDETPLDILYRAKYGHSSETYLDAGGNEHYMPFNPSMPYFYFNGCGNLVSCYFKDYSDLLDGDFVEELSENRHNIYWEEPEELSELLDKLEAVEEETED